MPRFFTKEISEDKAIILSDDAKHIKKSLRMKIGDEIEVCDGEGLDYLCEILSLSEEEVTAKILSKKPSETEANFKLTLFMGSPKSDKMELIIQKSVELGAYCIVPFISEFCVSRPDEKSAAKKTVRYNKIAFEAAKQSRRSIIPKVLPQVSFNQLLEKTSDFDLVVFFYENAEKSLREALEGFDFKEKNVAVIVGSEGGFSEKEANALKEKGVFPLSLGKRILRCETAPIAGISAIMFSAGEM